MKAIILAGGKGARLRPYTTIIPKPLVPVKDKAILEILIGRLKKYGITEITLCVNHLYKLIMAYFGNGEEWGVKIGYSLEDKPLGTIAPLKLIKNLPNNFFVMNGDVLTDINFKQLFEFHLREKALLTVAVTKRRTKIDFGIFDVDKTKNIALAFREKPEYELNVSTGIYVFNKKVLDFVPRNKSLGFDELVFLLLEEKQTIKLFPFEGYWLDIGRPEDYEKANEDIDKLITKGVF